MLNLLSKLWSGLLPRRRRYLDAAQYNIHPSDLTFLTDVAPGRWVESALDASFATMGPWSPAVTMPTLASSTPRGTHRTTR